MDNTYQKTSGSGGSKGVDFQIDLLSVFLLNALQNIQDWRLSTENKLAGKFDDVVLELADGSAILLQAKHKENKKVTLNQLLSTNSKNEDFSLPKYFFSYLNDVKSRFPVKSIIICTNTQADSDISNFLKQHSVCRDNMLHYEDDAVFFTFSDKIVPDLIANSKVYNKNNLRENSIEESTINEESVTEFLTHLQIHLNYPSGNGFENVIEKLLSALKRSDNLFRNTSHRDIYKKVKNWFEQPKGEYLTECRAKAMFCEIKSAKYRSLLEDYKVFFRNKDFSFTDSEKRIFHVVAEGGYLLHLLKVHRSLQHNETKILYAGPDDGLDVQEQVIRAFKLPQYTYLIIVSPKFSEEFTVNKIYVILRDILHIREYKKVVLVGESNNKLTHRIKSAGNDCEIVDTSPTLADLSEDSQDMLLRKKNIVFQGEDVTLTELFPKHIIDDIKKCIKSETLEKLLRGEKIKIGKRLTDLEDDISRYYINRKFERTYEMHMEEKYISEKDIYDSEEKIVLISDGPGGGKTTVLKNLAATIKRDKPQLWVIKIELNDCTKTLRDSLKHGTSINVQKLLSCTDTTRQMSELETIIFSVKVIVVLMLDGVDEISPDYESLIMDFLLQSQKAENLQKIFITARSHMEQKLAIELTVASFTLVPLTEQNQIDFFVHYWTHSLNLEGKNMSKCERYATTLINRVGSWTINGYDNVKFASSPLQARMLAEIFLENKGHEEWEGCKEYLSGDEMEPKLPVKMNIVKLYDMFIDKKRDIFMNKGNPTGNTTANQALMEQFKECVAYHKSLALDTILYEEECAIFSYYQSNYEHKQIEVLKMGIVQKLSNKLSFVHRTFAEYFAAESIVNELQFGNKGAKFQKLLIEKIFLDTSFDITRRLLDSFLQQYMSSLDIVNLPVEQKPNINIVNEFGCTGLHCAANEGNFHIAEYLVRHDADIHIKDNAGRMALYIAASSGSLEIVELLVKKGVDTHATNENGLTALHRAAHNGHFDIVESLVRHNADIYIVDKYTSSTTLHMATLSGRLEIVELLVKQGLDINAADKDGWTALHRAAHKGYFNIVEFLVRQDADIHIANNEGSTTLHMAAKSGSFKTVEFVMKQGVNINAVDEYGWTALHRAAHKGYYNIVEFFVKQDADIHIANRFGRTALHMAATNGSLKIVELLVRQGVNIHAADKHGWTALHRTAQGGHFDIVEFLVTYDANIHITNNEGSTTLHKAVLSGNLKILELLVKQGVNINAVDNDGWTALHKAAEGGHFDIVEFLVRHDANIHIRNNEGSTALHTAVLSGSLKIVELLVQQGVDIHAADNVGSTALHSAVFNCHFGIVEFLLRQAADIQIADNKGSTALHMAALRSNLKIVQLLVQQGADVNAADENGWTALHRAADFGSFTIVEFLVRQDADIHIANREGYTALHFAAISGNLKIVELLVKQVVDINVTNNEGCTALQFAVETGKSDIVEFLEKHRKGS